MKNSYSFYSNKECVYYPCHKELDVFNCMFCFCPLYSYINCLGTPKYIDSKDGTVKDCSECLFPHRAENYNKIVKFLSDNKK